MSTSGRAGVLSAAAGLSRAAAAAPDWRAVFAAALAREVEERRFFLWLPVAAMGGVALNLAADREPVLWLPAALTAFFAGARLGLAAPRPVALGLSLGACGPVRRLSVDVAAHRARRGAGARPHPHRVALQGYVEEVDLRPVGARMVIAVDRRRRHAARDKSRAASG